MDYNQYLQKNGFDTYFRNLKQKLKDKKILVYGAGQVFQFVQKNYDLSDLNIIGICDKQFTQKQDGQNIYGYKAINVNNINKYDYDCVLISVLKYYNLGHSIRSMVDDKNVEFYPLVRQKFADFAKDYLNQKLPLRNFCSMLKSYFAFENSSWSKKYDKDLDEKYIELLNKTAKNYKKLLKRIKKKSKTEKIRVGFVCFDSARWKAQSLYELMERDEHFEPFIIMSRLYIGKGNQTRLQTEAEYKEKCEYFEKNHRVEHAYDIKKDKYIALKNLKADYIFYQLPFYCAPNHLPVETSKNSLTAYIPYCVALTVNETKFDTFFRACLHKYYLPYKEQEEYYSQNMRNNGKNICVSGHTSLDDFYLRQVPKRDCKPLTVIYSPHHSLEKSNPLKLATFLELGEPILEYAKQHPEIKWIFRPHPLLKNVLKTVWNAERVETYYKDWETIGVYDTDGDYMSKFYDSDLLINDSGFILEYFPTGHPLIQLINPNYAPYDNLTEKVIDSCYKVQTKEELIDCLNKILVDKNDSMKEQRENLIKELKLRDIYAAENILNDIKRELEII